MQWRFFGDGGCAVQTNGSVYCWGAAYSASFTAVQISGITNATAVSAFGFSSNIYPTGSPCVVTATGAVQCFSSTSNVVNIAGLTGVTKVVALDNGGCALTNQSAIYCWSNASPTAVEISAAPNAVDFSATVTIAPTTELCYLNNVGAVFCAQTTTLASATFAQVQGVTNAMSLGSDESGIYALTNTGSLYSFNRYFSAGAAALQIASDPNAKSFSTAYGQDNICFLNTDQSAFCEGPGQSPSNAGRLLLAKTLQATFVPVQIKSDDVFVQAELQSSNFFVSACSTTTGGTVDCWGDGFSATPTPVSDVTGIKSVTFADGAAEFLSGAGLVFQDLLSLVVANDIIAQMPGLSAVTEVTNGAAFALSGGNIFAWTPGNPQATPTETNGPYIAISSNGLYVLDNAGNVKHITSALAGLAGGSARFAAHHNDRCDADASAGTNKRSANFSRGRTYVRAQV